MALQGTLDTFSLPDVLRLLATTGKSGRLRIDGDRGYGSVWLEEGSVVAAEAERVRGAAPTDELLFELMRFGAGSFSFDVDQPAQDAAPPRDVEQLLGSAASLLDEWHELERVVPSLDHRVVLASELPRDHVTIDAGRWQTVVAIASAKTIADLADALGLSELGVSRAVHDLVELGVVSVDPADTVTEAPLPQGSRSAVSTPRPTAPPAPDLTDTEEPAPPAPAEPVEAQRAGWLQADGAAEPRWPDTPTSDPEADNGQTRRAPSESGRPPPVAPEPAPTGALSSRIGGGRRRSSVPDRQARRSIPPAAGDVHNVPRPGRRSRRGVSARPVPPAPVTDPTLAPIDGAAVGPTPVPADTGRTRTVPPPGRRSDLHWAADDGTATPAGGSAPAVGSPLATGPLPLRPTGEGEVASHVAAMTAEARAAVQATVGNDGGSTGPPTPTGDDDAQRGTLVKFLSSVKP